MMPKARAVAIALLGVLGFAPPHALAQSKDTAEVQDPLLAPVGAPARRLARWSDVSTNLRARSVDLQEAVAVIRQAEAESSGALAQLFGAVSGTAVGIQNLSVKDSTRVVGVTATGAPIAKTTSIPTPRVGNLGATASVPLFAPRTWQQIKTANLGVNLANEVLADQRRVLVEGAAKAVVAVVAAERVAEINRVGLRAAIERSALARKRQVLGGGTALDIARADKDLETARAQVVSGDESLRQAREALGLALGWGEQVGVEPTFRLDDAVVEATRQCRRVSNLSERADIVAARERIRVAEQSGREARAGFYPTLGVQSQVNYTTDDIPLTYHTQWNVQGVISWDIWDGGTRYAQIRSSAAQRDAAEARLEGARRELALTTQRADRAIEVATASRAIAQRAREAAAEQERLTRIAYTTGAATSLELVTAASDLRAADIQLVQREYELVGARLLALLVRARCDF